MYHGGTKEALWVHYIMMGVPWIKKDIYHTQLATTTH